MADQVQGGLPPVEKAADESTTVGVAKPVASKGPYSLGTPIGAVGYDPELLANMQSMIAEREARKNSFQERMKDAMAWWSGGVAGPAEPLQNRAIERARQEAELFGMKSQLSQAKLGQQQVEALRKADQASGWGEPSTAGGAGTSGDVIELNKIDPGLVKQYNLILNTEGVAAANKFKNSILQKRDEIRFGAALKPESYEKEIKVYDMQNNGQLTTVPAIVAMQNPTRYRLEPTSPTKPSTSPTGGAANAPSAADKANPSVAVEHVTKNPILRNIAGGESDLRNIPNAAGTSTAYGVYQMTKPTFNNVQKNHPELAGISWEQFQANPRIQTAFAEAQFADNEAVLKKNNIPVNEDTHHAMWFSGNTKLATLPDNAPISQALTAEQIAANNLQGKTVGDVRASLRNRRLAAGTTTAPADVAVPAAKPTVPAVPGVNEWDDNTKMLPGHAAPVAPTAAPAAVATPTAAPAATTTQAGTLPPPPAPPSSFAAPLQQQPSTGNRMEDLRRMEIQSATDKANIEAEKAGKTEFAKQDYEKKAEYNNSVGTADNTFNELDKLLDVSKGKKNVFNLAGQGFIGPAAAWLLHKEGAKDAETNETMHDTVARTILGNKEKTDYDLVKQGAAVAQAAWAKNLVQGAGGRLTNADLALGKVAKGVGVEQTYESHMANLAKQMEMARTAYYRGLAFKEWSAQNPNKSVAEFESSPEYQLDAKIKAAKDTAQKFKDVPEANYIKKDKNGAPYVIVNGKGYYL